MEKQEIKAVNISQKAYLVGGAVRDQMLGLEVNDHDYVVVGSSVSEMVSLGYKQVGRDFPIFLHPTTSEEYALARTQRHEIAQDSAQDSNGVTLEQDLGRRDFTINAMAIDSRCRPIDPYGGQADLRHGIIRHVSPVTFSDDPLRILRMARFSARYGFTITPETMGLARRVVTSGGLEKIAAERIWQELSKGLMENNPVKMIGVLRETGALKAIIPELDALFGIVQPRAHHPEIDTGLHVLMALNRAVEQGASLEVRFAALMHDLGKGLTPKDMLPAHHGHEESGVALVREVCDRLNVPANVRRLSLLACAEHTRVHRSEELKRSSVISLLERTDAFRRPDRFEMLMQVCECDARGRLGLEKRDYPQALYLKACLFQASSVDAGEVAQSCKNPAEIPMRIHQARISSLSGIAHEDFFPKKFSKSQKSLQLQR